ncbi:MAG: methyltransferase domain-containing protein [Verrucomicrobiaceae bacterium]|nr:MAG: methyltransferase domain-containing protein [Verrucomicrobiaceae bacterium]
MPEFLARLTSEDPGSFSSRMRARRMGRLLDMIRTLHQKHGQVSILDIGGRKRFWQPIVKELPKYSVKVSIINLPDEIDRRGGNGDDDVFTHVKGDACRMPQYADKSFHLAVSNSVIEHVGNWSQVRAFASEARRVAEDLFVQTPNFWFPVEPHYVCPLFHWLPRPMRAWLFMHFKFAVQHPTRDLDKAMTWVDEAPRLLTRRMLRHLFPDCRIIAEKFLIFFNKSWMVLRD